MTTRPLGMLDDLDYPDLSFLMKLAATGDRQTSPWRSRRAGTAITRPNS